MPMLKAPPGWVPRLPRAIQWFGGVSCQHPLPIDTTTLGEGYETAMCNACGTHWHQKRWTWRW